MLALMMVAAIAAMVLVPSAAVAAAGGPPPNVNGGPSWKDNGGYRHGNGNLPDPLEQMDILHRGRIHGLIGNVTYQGGVVSGTFVTFAYDQQTGAIRDFVLRTPAGNFTVFSSIAVEGIARGSVSSHGALVIINGTDMQVIVHDNPTGMIHIVMNSTIPSITYRLAAGMEVISVQEQFGNCSLGMRAMIGDGAILGVIAAGSGTLTYGDDAGAWVKIENETALSMVRFAPPFRHGQGPHAAQILDAIASSRLGGEMSLVCGEQGASFDVMEYDQGLTMKMLQARRGFVQLEISSDESEGRAVLINLDRGSMPGNMRVLVDGVQVRLAASSAEVLYADGGADACYYVMEEENTSSVALYLPALSTQSVVIESSVPLPDISTSTGAIVLVCAAALTIVAAVLLFRRK
jgi:hypothetical protein